MDFDAYNDHSDEDHHYGPMAEEEARAQERRGQEPPFDWGKKINQWFYFCHSCWFQGVEAGDHPYDQPPCDPIKST